MAGERDKRSEQQEGGARPSQGEAQSGGNSLQDASEEMVEFMEESDEPGHAGRGDGG